MTTAPNDRNIRYSSGQSTRIAEIELPLFMDRHDLTGATPAQMAEAHTCDLALQEAYQVRFITYWHHEGSSTGFCLVEAPNAEVAQQVHHAAHGNVATQVIEVDWQSVEAFLGSVREPADGRPWEDFPSRTVICVRLEEPGGAIALTAGSGAFLARAGRLVDREASARGGRAVPGMPAGVLGCFASAPAAIECALALQESFVPLASLYERVPVRMRIGIGVGEPVEGLFGLFGAAIHTASALCDRAFPGQTLVTGAVRDLCKDKPLLFEPVGYLPVEGIEGSVLAYRLDGRIPSPAAAGLVPGDDAGACGLSPREVEVLRMIADGKTNREIAADLWLSLSTVATHVRNIFAKANVENRAEATAFAYRNRLIR